MFYLKLLKAVFFFIVEISFDNKDDWNLKSGKFRPIAWVRFITFCCAIVVIAVLANHVSLLTSNNVSLRKKLGKAAAQQTCTDDESKTKPTDVDKTVKN